MVSWSDQHCENVILVCFSFPFFCFYRWGKEKKTTPSLGEKARNTVEISTCPPEKGLPHLRGGLRGKRGQSVFPSNTVWDFIACKETIQVEWFVHFSSDFQSLISFVSPRKSCNLTTPFLFAASIPLFLAFAAGERKTTTVCGGTEQFATLSTFPWNVSFCYLQWKRVFKVSHKNSAENDSIRYKQYGNLFFFQLFIGARLIRNIFCAFKESLWKAWIVLQREYVIGENYWKSCKEQSNSWKKFSVGSGTLLHGTWIQLLLSLQSL